MEKHIPCKWKPKREGVDIPISNKLILSQTVIRDKEGHHIIIKGLIHEEE